MKKLISLLLLISMTYMFSQNSGWSEPVRISQHGDDLMEDFTIDKDGIIHCVWVQKYESNFWQLYYSKSTDEGDNWSEPEDISKNDNKEVGYPRICTDSKNNVYVTYDFDMGSLYYTEIHMRVFDGEYWSEADTVSKGYTNATLSCLAIDNNDRVYVFWHVDWSAGRIYYRYMENSTWSPVDTVYKDDDDYLIGKVVIDKENNLHCTGIHKREEQGVLGYAASYYKYDYANDTWSDILRISTNTCRNYRKVDIALDSNDKPHLIWSQYREDSLPRPEGSYYSFYNDTNWIEPKAIGRQDALNELPCIVFDANDYPSIVIWREYRQGNLRYYYLYEHNILNNTEKTIIDSTRNYPGFPKLLSLENNLFLLNTIEIDEDTTFVEIRKKKVTTSIDLKTNIINGFKISQNYPNPFNNSTILKYELDEETDVKITIYDIRGVVVNTIIREHQKAGSHTTTWNGTDNNGINVSSGIYFYKMTAGKYTAVKKMVLLQ